MSPKTERARAARLERAVLLVAEDVQSDEQIAAAVGLSKRQLERWKTEPAFAALVQARRETLKAAIVAEGIANRQNRVDAQNDRWHRLQTITEERGASEIMKDVPGGKTGLLVRQVKQIGMGKTAERVEEFVVDTGLLSEMRALEKQAAQELDQWTEKAEMKHDASGSFLDALRSFGRSGP